MKWTQTRAAVGVRILAIGAMAAMFAIAPAVGQGSSAPSAPEKLKPGVEILSDTQGVDFSPYLHQLHVDIQRNWDAVIPKKAQSPELKKGAVGILFTILPDGKIGSMKLETRSGDVDLDKAAWYAITSEGSFPALPTEFHGPQLSLRMGFFYNTPHP
jgi:TonB family protein